MPITINGTGSITGISAGGLPDLSIVTADLADAAVTTVKMADANITPAKLNGAQSGSAPIYGARAWGAFSMSGTLTIRASGNVSSITDNGTDATVNFTTAMQDANYSIVTSQSYQLTATYVQGMQAPYGTYSTTQFGLQPFSGNNPYADAQFIQFAVFR